MKRKVIACLTAVAALACVNVCTGFTVVSANTAPATYCGSGSVTEQSETINYATKESVEYQIKSEIPDYHGNIGGTSCANMAGAVVIGYYDRMCEELIPNYQAYRKLGSAIIYKMQGVEVDSVIERLYTLMGTDTSGAGTTFNGFQNGMKAYVNGQGYSYSTEDVGSINMEKYKAAIESEKPVAVFLSSYSVLMDKTDSGSSVILKSERNSIGHVVIGYGYQIETYYNSSNQVVATRTYLKVASGLFNYGKCYLCLDGKSSVDRATAIKIE